VNPERCAWRNPASGIAAGVCRAWPQESEELNLSLERLLRGLAPGVEQAAELLRACREGLVLIIGDYDADGATSTALIVRALRAWGFAQVDFLVPNRFEFGYG